MHGKVGSDFNGYHGYKAYHCPTGSLPKAAGMWMDFPEAGFVGMDWIGGGGGKGSSVNSKIENKEKSRTYNKEVNINKLNFRHCWNLSKIEILSSYGYINPFLTIVIWVSSFLVLRVSVDRFHFYCILHWNFCKQTVLTLIRGCVLKNVCTGSALFAYGHKNWFPSLKKVDVRFFWPSLHFTEKYLIKSGVSFNLFFVSLIRLFRKYQCIFITALYL